MSQPPLYQTEEVSDSNNLITDIIINCMLLLKVSSSLLSAASAVLSCYESFINMLNSLLKLLTPDSCENSACTGVY